MDERYTEHSSTSSEGESALSSRVEIYRSHQHPAPTSTPDQGPDKHDAEELMLSEFLLSLQGSAGYHVGEADMLQSSYTATATAPAPRGLGRRTAAGLNGKAPAARRTVVHRRKRRDDLAGPCNHCGALTSPQWRKGPKGKPVLCNACGIRFLRNRTLTKVMPKKRRHGAGSKRNRASAAASAVAAEGDDDELFDDPMAAADADMEDTYSAAAAAAAAHAYAPSMPPELFLQPGMLAGTDVVTHCSDDCGSPRDGARAAEAAVLDAAGAAAGAGAGSGIAAAPLSQLHPAAPAASRDSLFSTRSNSSRNLLAQLGDCPSLTLALALHQQQQQRRQQEEQDAEDELQQQSSKYSLPKYPELQLFPPSSPPADSAGTGFASSPLRMAAVAGAHAAPGAASSGHSTGSLLQLQHQYSSSASPPLSPLFLGAASTGPALPAGPVAAVAGAPQPQPGDMLQLVQQLGGALGGVGPAIEFLKLCSGNPAALAAAVAAVATSAAVSAQ